MAVLVAGLETTRKKKRTMTMMMEETENETENDDVKIETRRKEPVRKVGLYSETGKEQ